MDSVEDCLKIVRNTYLEITFDTCHYAAGLSPERDGKIDLVAPAKAIGDYLGFLHISDVSGHWGNGGVWKEGIIPGDGRIGKTAFKKFFQHIREAHPNIGICVEVANADFSNPRESEEAIKRVIRWWRNPTKVQTHNTALDFKSGLF